MNDPPLDLHAEPLSSNHDRSNFACGVEALDRYLQRQASQDVRSGVSAVFVLTPGDGTIAGFYTLSTDTIKLAELPPETVKKMPHYPVVPGILLGRLAVHQNLQGRRIGEALLFDAFRRAHATVKDVASWALIVNAKDESARKFYERYEFRSLPGQSLRLYLPMSEIKLLIATMYK